MVENLFCGAGVIVGEEFRDPLPRPLPPRPELFMLRRKVGWNSRLSVCGLLVLLVPDCAAVAYVIGGAILSLSLGRVPRGSSPSRRAWYCLYVELIK